MTCYTIGILLVNKDTSVIFIILRQPSDKPKLCHREIARLSERLAQESDSVCKI